MIVTNTCNNHTTHQVLVPIHALMCLGWIQLRFSRDWLENGPVLSASFYRQLPTAGKYPPLEAIAFPQIFNLGWLQISIYSSL